MPNLARKLELISNATFLCLAILIGGTLVRDHLIANTTSRGVQRELVGRTLSLDGINWKSNHKTVILVLSPTCGYCRASAPFYQKLSSQRKAREFKLVAVLPTSVEQSTAYLADDLKIPTDQILQVLPTRLNITGTPTLLIVNDEGRIVKAWKGQLPPPIEREVFNNLQSQGG